jgi:hypothetical protein
MFANSHRRHRFPPVEFADHLEAWGAASLGSSFAGRGNIGPTGGNISAGH